MLPLTHGERFEAIGIRPPKGVLLYGPPGTGKTLMARACAAQTNACFLKLAGPQLVQMFIGDGAKLVRDAFLLAKEKSAPGSAAGGAIIFIDELDAVGTKRFDSELSGDRSAPSHEDGRRRGSEGGGGRGNGDGKHRGGRKGGGCVCQGV